MDIYFCIVVQFTDDYYLFTYINSSLNKNSSNLKQVNVKGLPEINKTEKVDIFFNDNTNFNKNPL